MEAVEQTLAETPFSIVEQNQVDARSASVTFSWQGRLLDPLGKSVMSVSGTLKQTDFATSGRPSGHGRLNLLVGTFFHHVR